MKRKLLTNYNKVLAYVISLLGISATFSCCMYGSPVEYGTPVATYKVSGNVSDENDNQLQGIRVVLRNDTSFTNENGVYSVQANDFPGEISFPIAFSDVDGDTNGRFQSKDTSLTFTDPEFINGDGEWNQGETSKDFDIKLKNED